VLFVSFQYIFIPGHSESGHSVPGHSVSGHSVPGHSVSGHSVSGLISYVNCHSVV
jgi:hypothetical protein